MIRRFRFTPEHIEDLHPNEVFVFGSNANGNHYGGAANLAYQRFGAVWGVGEGLRGNSYALPTLNRSMERVSLGALKQAFKHLFQEIDFNSELCFLLTKVGCGIAGYTVEEVACSFWESVNSFYNGRWTTYVGSLPEGLIIPEEFYDYMPQPYRKQERFNKLNSDLLFIEKQLQRTHEKVARADDAEEYELLQDTLRELESQRNSLQEDLRKFIATEIL